VAAAAAGAGADVDDARAATPGATGDRPQEPESSEAVEGAEPTVGRYGDGGAEIHAAWFEDEHGARAEALPTGRPCSFAATVRFNAGVENPLFGINVQNSQRDHVLSASNLWTQPRCGLFRPGDEVTFRVSFQNVLAPDRYYVTPAVARHGGAWIDRRERMISVIVTGTRNTDALLELPYEVAIERGAPSPARAELVG
jgi:hypothetical protein